MKKNNFKKLLLILMVSLVTLFIFVSTPRVYATESDNMKASYIVDKTLKTARFDYTNYKVDAGLSSINSTTSKQTVCVFTQKQTENSKVVNWAVINATNTGFKFSTIPNIAKNYEETHPDWFVVGGTNADQYIMSQGTGGVSNGTDYMAPQPYYPMVADGDSWFSVPCWPRSGGGSLAAFLQDGSTDPIVNGSMNLNSGNVKIKGLFLAIYNENGEIENNFKIENINKEPANKETSVYCPYYQISDSSEGIAVKDMDVTGTNLFICEKADLAYMNNNQSYSSWKKNDGYDSLFCKGTISTTGTSTTLKNGSFAIDTKNEEVLKAIATGKKVRVQLELEGIYSEVESVVGFHTIQRMDGKDIASSASYNTQSYSRSLFGRTSSGQIVLITVDMGNSDAVGTKHDETNAILKHYGCVEAYQMDGGSSVAAVGRDENGNIVVIDQPKGYSGNATRAVLSALLLVERRAPEYNVELIETTQTTAKFKVEVENIYGRNILRTYIKVNDKDYEVDEDGFVTVDGLRKNKEYYWNLCYEDTTGADYKTESKGTFETAKDAPIFNGCEMTLVSGNMTFTVDFTDRGNALLQYSIISGDIKETIKDMSITQVSIPESDEVVYLEYVYSKGAKDETVLIKYPHYKAYQKAKKISDEKDKSLGGIFN